MHSLQQNNIDIKMCRGRSYDGERIGVQAKIKDASPLATHCRSHVLNLSIASARLLKLNIITVFK